MGYTIIAYSSHFFPRHKDNGDGDDKNGDEPQRGA
jgi:hypothetical protein